MTSSTGNIQFVDKVIFVGALKILYVYANYGNIKIGNYVVKI